MNSFIKSKSDSKKSRNIGVYTIGASSNNKKLKRKTKNSLIK